MKPIHLILKEVNRTLRLREADLQQTEIDDRIRVSSNVGFRETGISAEQHPGGGPSKLQLKIDIYI